MLNIIVKLTNENLIMERNRFINFYSFLFLEPNILISRTINNQEYLITIKPQIVVDKPVELLEACRGYYQDFDQKQKLLFQ